MVVLASRRSAGYRDSVNARLLLGLLLIAGCTKGNAAPPTSPETATTPEPIAGPSTGEPGTAPLDLAPELRSVEQTMLDLDFVVRFDVESSGALHSRFIGELRAVGDEVILSANGKFGDKVFELNLHGDGKTLEGTNGTAKLDLPQPPALKEALVIGLIRMGILHNLAVLISARPPDHADGGVEDWVQTESVALGAKVGPEQPTQEVPDQEAMSFGLVVAGAEAGNATLWWDTTTKLPIERHQVVDFPDGQMVVRETYTVSSIGPG